MSNQPTMSVREAARMLDLSLDAIYVAIRKGDLQGERMTLAPKSPYRLYTTSVEQYARRRAGLSR